MWQYNDKYNYYFYKFDVHMITVQEQYGSYSMRFYMGKEQLTEIKAIIDVLDVEVAKAEAIRITRSYISKRVNYWNNVMNNFEKSMDAAE